MKSDKKKEKDELKKKDKKKDRKEKTYNYFKSLDCDIIAYYHNLKFDGSFWLSYLLVDKGFKQANKRIGESEIKVEWLQEKYMQNNTFKYSISDKGMWYGITIKAGGHFIEIRDSLKLLPFSVKRIGQSFGTKHKKLDMEYTGFRYAGCAITPEEKHYIANDVLEALETINNTSPTMMTQLERDEIMSMSTINSEGSEHIRKMERYVHEKKRIGGKTLDNDIAYAYKIDNDVAKKIKETFALSYIQHFPS